MELIQSNKSILRAIARTYVHHRNDVYKLVNKYNKKKTNKNISHKEFIESIIELFETNRRFSKDFSNLMIRKKEIASSENKRNAIGILGSVVGLVSNIFSSNSSKVESVEATKQRSQENMNSMMTYILEEEKRKTSESKSQNTIILASLIGVFAILGIAIYKKNS